MKFSRQMAVTLLASFNGVLGNLIAAFIQTSLGQITLLQVVFMFTGVVLVSAIAYGIENKNYKHQRELDQLWDDLNDRRSQLLTMQSLAENGKALTDQQYAQWYHYQQEIRRIKARLREEGFTEEDDYIDLAKAPRAPLLARLANSCRSMGMLSVVLFAFLLSFPLSIGAQAAVVSLWNVPVDPEIVETPTPLRPEPTVELEPTEQPIEEPEPTAPPQPEPTEEILPEPTEEAVTAPETTPTGRSVDFEQGTLTAPETPLVSTSTPPPTPAAIAPGLAPALAASVGGGGELFYVAEDLDLPTVFVGEGTGSLTGRAVWDGEPVQGVKIGLVEDSGSGLGIIGIATTNQGGIFGFEGLQAKPYELIVEPPDGYSVRFEYCGYDTAHPDYTFNGLRYPAPIVEANATTDIGDIKLAAEVVTALYPINGVAVTERAPILRWEPYREADRYYVCLSGILGQRYATSEPFLDLSKYDQIDPGSISWQVYAFTRNGLVAYS